MRDVEIIAALEPVVDHPRGLAIDVEQKAGIPAAELLVKLDKQVAERKIEDARHDQHRKAKRHAGGVFDRGQAAQYAAQGAIVVAMNDTAAVQSLV